MSATPRAVLRLPALALGAALALAGCGRQAPAEEAQAVGAGPADLFSNGDFETGDLSGWDPVVTNLNGTLSAVPPTTVAQLNLQAGGTNLTHVITGPNGQVVPALLSAGGSTLRVPRYGTHVAVVNEYSSNVYGHGQNVNTLKQSMTVSNADVDPADGKVHVRFAIAPVLENPSHADNQQPYFWIQLWNNTRGAQLFYTFNFSNQSGVPWKTDSTTGVLYTDWKAFDISPGPAQLAVGDQVELRVVAAGCSLGGHDGHVYVDSFGPILPGLSVTATAPQSVNRGATLTYTLTYKNAGPGGADGVVLSEVLPANTTFSSISAPGVSCVTPAVGAAGTVTCTLGTLNEATTGSLTITVTVAAGATVGSYISNGNYQIQGTDVSALIGPLVQTVVTSGVTYADLSVTASDGQAAVGWGSARTYTVVASNAGPGAANGATISAPLPAQLTGATWDCAATGGAVCPAVGGTFPSSIPTLPSGGSVTIHQYASVVSGSGSGSVAYQVTVATPGGVTDPDSTNNVAMDTDSIGTLHSFTVSKAGHGTGTVVSVPTAISCGSTCTASFLDGTIVVLTATAAPGSLFTGWSGACTGTSTTCTTTLSADATTTATFIVPHTITASAPAGNGTISCTSPVDDAASTTCTLAPASHYYLTGLTDNGANVLGSVSGNTYVSGAVTSNRTIVATFSPTVSSLALGFSPVSPVSGQPVTITATAAGVGPTGTPTGTVTFYADGVAIPSCSGVSLASGAATCSVARAAGTYSLTATYGGDATWNGSTAPAVQLAVGAAGTTTQVASSLNPSSWGAPVTFTVSVAAVAPGTGTPAGQVELFDGATSLGTATLNGSGQAGFTTSALAVGSHTMTATYAGTSSFAGSTSPGLTQAVVRASASVALAIAPASTVFGQPVTLTATVSSSAGAPAGTVSFYADGVFLGTGTVQPDGTATLVTGALPVGTSSITASYQGSTNHAPADSSAGAHTVTAASSQVALGASPAASVFGQSATFTATVTAVAPGVGTPTGSVEFRADGAILTGCAAVALSGGTATCSTSALAVGGHPIVATYSGSTSFNTSTSSTHTYTVSAASSQVALGANPASTILGQSVTFTATVSAVAPGAGTPTGTVEFRADGSILVGCAAVALSGGTATCSTSSLSVGGHPIVAIYSGSTSFLTSTSSTLTYTVNAASSQVALGANPASTVVGQSVTFTATVSAVAPGAGTPTGTVEFRADGSILVGCAAVALSGGTATCSTSSLAVGAPIVATYSGSTSFLTSTSPTLTYTVNAASSQVALIAGPASPTVFGQTVTFTATVAAVAPGAGTPTGTVQFTADGTAIAGCAAVALSGGTATCSTSALAVGGHPIVATYSGSTSFNTSTSSALTYTVNQASSQVALSASPVSPTVFGQSVTFTATVSAVAPGAGTPTGTVEFRADGSILAGCAAVALSGGTATCSTSSLAVGGHPIVATYSGSTSFNSSTSSTLTYTVNAASSQVALAANPATTVFGQSETFTATASAVAPGAGTPTGTVEFRADGAILAGCAAVALSGGTATCSTSSLAVGGHPIVATYSGSSSFNTSTSSTLTYTVNAASSQVALGANPASTVLGQSVTFTATVSAVAPGSGTPAGTVEFRADGSILAGCAAVALSGGTATCSTSSLAVGGHPVVATYSGSTSFLTSTSSTLSHSVNAASSQVALGANPASAILGQSVTFTATVTAVAPGAGTPTGTVEFRADGSILAGCAAVALSGGTATCSTSSLAVGGHPIVATYSGSTSFLTSTSSTLTYTVGAASSQVALGGNPASTVLGQSVTFTATVSAVAPGSGTPTGTVEFRADGSILAGCAAVALSGGTATCSTSALTVGGHAVVATYSGSTSFQASTSPALSHSVNAASSQVALEASPSPSLVGQSVTFTATVTAVAPGAGTPTGTVEFRADGSIIAGCATVALSSGTATCSTAALAADGHPIVAAYGGNASFQSSETSLTQTVNKAATTTELAAAPSPSVVGQAVTLTATVSTAATGVGTPSGTVTFKDGAAVLGTASLSGAGVATLSVSTLVAGDHSLTAEYGTSDAFLGSTGSAETAVAQAATTTTLAAAPSPARLAEPVTLTATVAAVAPGAGTPAGTVTFRDGGALLGTAALDGAGVATLSGLARLALGDHALTADFGGSASFLASQGGASLTVQQGATALAVASSLNPSRYGRPVTFTATVTSSSGAPDGTVTFREGETVLGTAQLDDAGVARLTLRDLRKGTHPIRAGYGGSTHFEVASGELAGGQVVENSPPVAGSGDALLLGSGHATSAAASGDGQLELVRTVELWARADWTAPGQVAGTSTLLRVGDDTASRYALGVAADRASLEVSYGGTAQAVAAALGDGAWHHLALVSSDGTITVLVDGAAAAALPGAFDDEAGDDVLVGDGFVGAIDEVRLWTTARTPADLTAGARRPVAAGTEGLAALWRMDDHLGATAFDAGPGAVDLEATLPAEIEAAAAFEASTAWRPRTATSGQPMAPVDAGYDADGDSLALVVTAPPAHGTASVDGGALQVGYRSDAEYGGADELTFQLDDGEARSSYAIEIAVTRSVACRVDADCAGGNLCVAGACTAPGEIVARSGGGCSSGGGGALLSGLLGLLLAGLLGVRRGPAHAGAPHGRGRAGRALLVLGLVLPAGLARAQTPAGFALQTYEPAPAGDRFFVVPGAAVDGHLQPAAGLVLSWAKDPLVLKRDGKEIPGGKIVKSQTWGWAVGSLTILDRVLLDVSVPVALAQSGDKPFSSFPRVTSSAMGDLRLGARTPLPTLGPVSLAAALELWLPTGKQQAFSSDQAVRALPQLIAGARLGSGEVGAQLGLLVRRDEDVTLTRTGNALAFSAGAAWPLGPVRVGPEVYGRWQFQGTATSPVEALLGARYGIGDVDLGLAAGTAFNDSPGAAPLRVVGQVMWRPRAAPPAPPPAAPVAAPSPPPDRDGDGIPDALDACPDESGPATDDSATSGCPPPPSPPPTPPAAVEPPPPPPAAPAPPPDLDGDGIPDALDACPDQPGPGNGDPARNGCPGLAAMAEGRIEIFQQIKFETDRDVIQPVSLPVLEEVARILAAHPEIVRMRIEGYTDARGSAVHNTDLSDRRAKAVRRWLVGKGIAPGRLEAKGYGPARPVADNASEVGRAANRRVEFRIE